MNLDPSYILASMFVSGVGYVLFNYGRKQRRFPHMTVGVVMLVYPYFVTDVGMMFIVGGVLVSLLVAVVRLGV